eukprot:g6395.t1
MLVGFKIAVLYGLFALCTTTVSSAPLGRPWISNSSLISRTTSRQPIPVPRYKVNLDLPPEDRWNEIAKLPRFENASTSIVNYLKNSVPKSIFPLISKVGKDIQSYFPSELASEMSGLAKAFGAPLQVGDLVAVNLVMQLEHIALNCSNWNDTGPTRPDDPGCMDVDPKQTWCYCKKHPNAYTTYAKLKQELGVNVDGPGLCTSVVAEDTAGVIFHGRNLDWNVPYALRKMAADVDFQRGNKTVFTGTTVVGFVGVFNGMKEGVFSGSIDARDKGGKILGNLLQALLHKSLTPSQHLRMVLQSEDSSTFESAINMLSTGSLIDQNYYIVGGVRKGEGAVIARGRNKAVDVWRLNESSWYRLETNYDHWNPVPKADDRRSPGQKNMNAMGQNGIGPSGEGIYKDVMVQWPTFNHHTDYTGIFSAAKGVYSSNIWTD